MWMIRGEVAMSETTFEMEGKATRSNRVILDVCKVETFANMLIHLLLLSKFRGPMAGVIVGAVCGACCVLKVVLAFAEPLVCGRTRGVTLWA
jgi:hypothetical protein